MQTNIKVKANHSKKTFTIYKDGSKFITLKMNKQEFEECLFNTSNDWINFLRTDNSYILIK